MCQWCCDARAGDPAAPAPLCVLGALCAIINSLSQLSGLRVVPRSLVFRYKGRQADPATVGLALSARTILTGRVVQQGDVLNIQAELVDTHTRVTVVGESSSVRARTTLWPCSRRSRGKSRKRSG
jgi:hypothetical protein